MEKRLAKICYNQDDINPRKEKKAKCKQNRAGMKGNAPAQAATWALCIYLQTKSAPILMSLNIRKSG